MKPTGCPKNSVRNYHYSMSDNPEEHSSLLLNIVYSSGPYFFLEIEVQKILFSSKLRSLNSVINKIIENM
jgi:hypothetical protein